MITVHHLNNSRSQRILWMLEELEQPYEIVKYERDSKTMLAPASLRAVHPLGKSPVITDSGATIAESGAILHYLVETYGKGLFSPPPGTPEHRDYNYFMHYAEGSLMPFLVMKLVFGKVATDAPLLVRPIAKVIAATVGKQYLDPNLEAHARFVADHLAKQPWFAGDKLTAADVQMSYAVEGLLSRGKTKPPALTAWVAKVQARPAYQRALARGGESKTL